MRSAQTLQPFGDTFPDLITFAFISPLELTIAVTKKVYMTVTEQISVSVASTLLHLFLMNYLNT